MECTSAMDELIELMQNESGDGDDGCEGEKGEDLENESGGGEQGEDDDDDDDDDDSDDDWVRDVQVTVPLRYQWLQPEYLEDETVVQFYQRACAEPEFLERYHFDDNKGRFQDPFFQLNPHLLSADRRSPCLERFETSLQELHLDSCLQVVFHGTPAKNVEPILRDGLDPSLRYRQAYGPGEYFTEDPLLSLSYSASPRTTRSGEIVRILVCLVVLPDEKSAKHVVIENSHHHIPIGTLSWVLVSGDNCTEEAWLTPTKAQTQMMEVRYENFCDRLLKNGWCNEDEQRNRVKEVILLDLQRKQYAMAAHLYCGFSHVLIGTDQGAEILNQLLSHICKGQISQSSVESRFPGLLG